jgi:hypothetical protein
MKKPKTPKPIRGWCVVGKYSGIHWSTFALTRKESISVGEQNNCGVWSNMRKNGFSVQQFDLVPVKAKRKVKRS